MKPAIIIIAVVVIIIVVNVIRLSAKSSSNHFECTECGTHFQVSFKNYFFTAHGLDGKCSVTCPNCHKTNMLLAQPGKD